MGQYFDYIRSKKYYKRATSSMDNLANATQFVFADGPARGMRAIQVMTGSGFDFTILPDRGMDIAQATYKGIPIAYITKGGIKNLALCGAENHQEFARYFMAGLVTTCGLDNVGGECEINGRHFPQHGRNTLTPAENICINKFWEKGSYWIEISGTMRQAALFGENLSIVRKIKVQMGKCEVWLQDEILNESAVNYDYMLMYHCNFGFPLVDQSAKVISNHKEQHYFDEISKKAGRHNEVLDAPHKTFEQNVFTLHKPATSIVKAAVINPDLGLGAFVECDEKQLACFTQWIQLAEQDYVLGLEPGKNHPIGREAAIKNKTCVVIKPGECHHSGIHIGILEGEKASDYERNINQELQKS